LPPDAVDPHKAGFQQQSSMYHYAAKDNGMIYLAVGPGSEHRKIAIGGSEDQNPRALQWAAEPLFESAAGAAPQFDQRK
jgi:hypothetical protein